MVPSRIDRGRSAEFPVGRGSRRYSGGNHRKAERNTVISGPLRIYLHGAEQYLPEKVSRPGDAIAAGRIGETEANELGYVSLPHEDELVGPELAVRSARRTLRAARVEQWRVRHVLHAWLYFQGHEFWSPAHFVAKQLALWDAIPYGVEQMCNGGAASLELANGLLAAGSAGDTALLTTGDRFNSPGFDRWAADRGLAYGDGGASVMVSPEPLGVGGLELVSVAQRATPQYEEMHRFGYELEPAPGMRGTALDIKESKKSFLREQGMEGIARSARESLAAVLEEALGAWSESEPGGSISEVILPRLGSKALDDQYSPVVREITGMQPVKAGRSTGHLGAGDVIASLADFEKNPQRRPGDVAVIVNAGGGFTYSCLVVRRR